MTNRHALTQRKDPSIQGYQPGWVTNTTIPDETHAPHGAMAGRPTHGERHHWRNGLQLSIIALLLTLLVLDRQEDLRALVQWPSLALTPTTSAALKAPTDVVKQRYERLVQEMSYQKAMIKNAEQSIALTQQNLDRFHLELSANQAALDALKAEYDLKLLLDN
jgi:hypothetical protein